MTTSRRLESLSDASLPAVKVSDIVTRLSPRGLAHKIVHIGCPQRKTVSQQLRPDDVLGGFYGENFAKGNLSAVIRCGFGL